MGVRVPRNSALCDLYRMMKDSIPAVSVLLCVYNERPAFLEAALGSLRVQSFEDFEIVVIDDGSTNQVCISSLERLAAADRRIRLFREPHRGLTRSLTVGVAYCRADLIARHDSDDWSDRNRLQAQVEFMRDHAGVGLIGTQITLHMEDGTTLWVSRLPEDHCAIVAAFPHFNPFCHGATMFRRELMLRAGGYRDCLPCSQDYDLFWRLSEITTTANLPEALYHHRRTSQSVSAARAHDQSWVTEVTRALARQRAMGAEDFAQAEVHARARLRLSGLEKLARRKQADSVLLAGNFLRAPGAFLALVARYPFDLKSYLALGRCIIFLLLPPARRFLFRA